MPELPLLSGRLGIEFSTIKAMVRLYCRAHQHKLKHVGIYCECSECAEFIRYANEKLDRCPYGQHKPTCNKCPIHCYKKVKRQQAQEIMRYAGPRMLLRHPILAIKHLIAEKRSVPTKIPNKASNRHYRNAPE